MASAKSVYKTKDSYIVIKDGKLYVLSSKYKDISPRAVQILPGLQVELGRRLNDFREALKETRLPILFKLVLANGDIEHYQIIRMQTGKVEDKTVATLLCNKGVIVMIGFNRDLLTDGNYRKHNNLSLFHQLHIAYELDTRLYINRVEQVKSTMSMVTKLPIIGVSFDGIKLNVTLDADGQKLKFNFACNKGKTSYELVSISI